jgi:anthraniloyl-CoA monooxygenase
MANDPVSAPRSATSSRIGTISTSTSTARRSARRATASSASAASGCSNILQERARELGVALHFEHEASADSTTGRIRPRHRRRRRQQPHPRRYEEHFGVDIQVRRNKFFWFGTTRCSTPSPSPSSRRGRLGLGARLSLRRRPLDLHRRDGAGDLGAARLRPDGPGRGDRAVRAHLRQISRTATSSCPTPALPGRQAWLNFRRIICERWSYGT